MSSLLFALRRLRSEKISDPASGRRGVRVTRWHVRANQWQRKTKQLHSYRLIIVRLFAPPVPSALGGPGRQLQVPCAGGRDCTPFESLSIHSTRLLIAGRAVIHSVRSLPQDDSRVWPAHERGTIKGLRHREIVGGNNVLHNVIAVCVPHLETKLEMSFGVHAAESG
jgi:hypothetical protein